jgi:pimeloyl-ACP methyl ester carboxylesterase
VIDTTNGALRMARINGHMLAARLLNPGSHPPDATPVVLLHGIANGLGFWGLDWGPMLDRFGPCFALSLPGHYPARFPNGLTQADVSPQAFAGLLNAAIDQLITDEPVLLVGISGGGFCAMALAAFHPQRVAGIVSICAPPNATAHYGPSFRLIQLALRCGAPGRRLVKSFFKPSPSHSAYRDRFQRYFKLSAAQPALLQSLDRFAARHYPYSVRVDRDAICTFLDGMFRRGDLRPVLGQIRAPFVAIFGARDTVLDSRWGAADVQQYAPHATVITLPHAAHVPFFEAPDEFQTALTAWIERTYATTQQSHG